MQTSSRASSSPRRSAICWSIFDFDTVSVSSRSNATTRSVVFIYFSSQADDDLPVGAFGHDRDVALGPGAAGASRKPTAFPVLRASSSPLTPVPSVEPDQDTAVGCCFSGRIHSRGGRGQAGAHGAYDPRRVDAGGVQQLGRVSGLWQVRYVARRQLQDRRAMRLIGESAQYGFANATLGAVILDGDDH